MHIPSLFKMKQQACYEFLSEHSFGQLISCQQGKISQSYLPFIIDKDNSCLYAHLAMQNPQLNSLENADAVTATFLGNDCYISPNWYLSEQQVPTWNYQAVEISGKAMLLDKDETLKIIDQLSQRHESQFEDPWLIGKLSKKKLNAMLKAIVGVKIEIISINGYSKMSQNKNVSDQRGVVGGLLSQTDHASFQVANIIKKGIEQ